MAWAPVIAGLVFAVCAGASFFFALAETALFSLGKWQTRQIVEREPARGGLVGQLLGVPHDLLATIVLGNTFANAGMVTVALWFVLRESWPAALTMAGALVLVLVAGEAIPKTLAVRAPDFWAIRVAQPMLFLLKVTRPLHHNAQRIDGWLVDRLVPKSVKPHASTAEEDYTELLEWAFQEGALAQSEKEILLQIISLDHRVAREVMRPRAQMDCLPDELPMDEMAVAARKWKHRRIPLYDGTPDTIIGMLNTRALLLDPKADLSEVFEFPSFVPESINLLRLLQSLQRQRRGLAVVLDEFGSTAGLVTVEDILGPMIGGIRGEGEAEGFVMERTGPSHWRVNGTMRLEDFRREYPDLGEVPEVETMGGLLVAVAEVVPTQGESVLFRGLRLTASVTDERRVRELLVEVVRKGGAAP